MTYVVAHRGLSSKSPENTYHSFDLAISSGINYIEFDVQLTKDKEVVIIHDETIDRTSNGFGEVKEKTMNELLDLDFGSWFSEKYKNTKIPQFSKLLESYNDINFVIEIKGSDKDLVPKVLELISKNNYWKDKIYESNNNKPKIIFCSFLPKQIEKLRFFSNDIAIGFLTKNIDQKVFDFVDQYHLNGLFPYYKLLNKELIEKLRKKNLMISSWGFENIEDANKLIKLGIDGVTVDWPDEIIVD
ncbi:glycerophosphodiester phosphodiesterase family protein [Chloroflexi bacterium]|nr:hypothetical protein [Chloroflexota bacterium]MDC0253052.1 glycerophosphodiester phosphodiesterase family protein [Chloroflexota bacterium]RZP14145.1 MAG: hypothetical protein EVA32_00830 [Chloroflexota bacterium]|tara:strand:+ start:13460 stop:14191 length:732 start_codon:yes stop_codon:yes gene_type:complete